MTNTTTANLTGTHYPNHPGARTIADARPLYIGTERVSVAVTPTTATLFIGLRMVAERPTTDFTTPADLTTWAQDAAAADTAARAEAEAWAPADAGTRELTDWERELIATDVPVIHDAYTRTTPAPGATHPAPGCANQ